MRIYFSLLLVSVFSPFAHLFFSSFYFSFSFCIFISRCHSHSHFSISFFFILSIFHVVPLFHTSESPKSNVQDCADEHLCLYLATIHVSILSIFSFYSFDFALPSLHFTPAEDWKAIYEIVRPSVSVFPHHLHCLSWPDTSLQLAARNNTVMDGGEMHLRGLRAGGKYLCH